MTTPVLGPDLPGFEVHLPLYEDFVGQIDIPDDEPALETGSSVRLYFPDISPPVEWLGVISNAGRTILFEVDELEVMAVRADRPKVCRLQYLRDERKLPWDSARVRYV